MESGNFKVLWENIFITTTNVKHLNQKKYLIDAETHTHGDIFWSSSNQISVWGMHCCTVTNRVNYSTTQRSTHKYAVKTKLWKSTRHEQTFWLSSFSLDLSPGMTGLWGKKKKYSKDSQTHTHKYTVTCSKFSCS